MSSPGKQCPWSASFKWPKDGSWRVLNQDCKGWGRTNSRCRLLWGKSWRPSSATEGNLLVELLRECHNKFRTICANIKEVKTTNLKGSAKQEDESSTHPHSSPDFAPSDFHLFGPPKGCTLRMPFCGRWQTEIQYAWRALMLQHQVLCDQHTASHAKVETECW
jgi:hypothetical protein